MRSIRVPAFAKVNLRLDILGRRPDGYHELRTIFQSLTLHDTLVMTLTENPGIELHVSGDVSLAASEKTWFGEQSPCSARPSEVFTRPMADRKAKLSAA